MIDNNTEKNNLISLIVEAELEMFMEVPTDENPSCREAPDNFKTHRSAQFSVWSKNSLRSYLTDLETARAAGRNLLTYKYARMDNLIPSENSSPLIGKIASVQKGWQRQMITDYPRLMKNARGLTDDDESELSVSFERYLVAELESYSVQTLEMLWADVVSFNSRDENMSEQIYLNLVKQMGFESLDSFK